MESVLTAATFKNSHNQHFRMYFVEPPPFLEAQTNESPSGHIWSHENIHHLPPPMSRPHDAGDMVECVYVRGRLMDGPAIRLGILQTAESEGESD